MLHEHADRPAIIAIPGQSSCVRSRIVGANVLVRDREHARHRAGEIEHTRPRLMVFEGVHCRSYSQARRYDTQYHPFDSGYAQRSD